ncbi:Hypothetical protein SMAX5B_005445 [Scophthalmus maximus]|uniref:Uncharacterized protein n=1 Tax=Scophthalmus maximus TaxID=52904 RepID=A0A2U9B1Y6_SCOMX|nr:Hypothetical protein SMAX5B_005445 [Scophthalmus maximus]
MSPVAAALVVQIGNKACWKSAQFAGFQLVICIIERVKRVKGLLKDGWGKLGGGTRKGSGAYTTYNTNFTATATIIVLLLSHLNMHSGKLGSAGKKKRRREILQHLANIKEQEKKAHRRGTREKRQIDWTVQTTGKAQRNKIYRASARTDSNGMLLVADIVYEPKSNKKLEEKSVKPMFATTHKL